jgi:hypothetical protein
MKNDVTDLDPPDQRIAGSPIAARIALRSMQIDTNVGAIRDLKPVALRQVAFPPDVQLTSSPRPVAAVRAWAPGDGSLWAEIVVQLIHDDAHRTGPLEAAHAVTTLTQRRSND